LRCVILRSPFILIVILLWFCLQLTTGFAQQTAAPLFEHIVRQICLDEHTVVIAWCWAEQIKGAGTRICLSSFCWDDTIDPHFHLVVDPHRSSLFSVGSKWRGRLDDVRLVLTTSLMWYFGFSPIDDRNDRMSFDMTNYAIFFLSLSLRV
jgi:hypothetical protein